MKKLSERIAVIETDMKHVMKSQGDILLEIKKLNEFKWYVSGGAFVIGIVVTAVYKIGEMIIK